MKNKIFLLIIFGLIIFSAAYNPNYGRGVFAALTAADTTTVITAGTYYPIEGTFSNEPIMHFTLVADPAIQYDDGNAWFEIKWNASISGDSNGMTVHVGLKKNGALIENSVVGTFLKIADEHQALGGRMVVWLTDGDKIQLVLTANGDGDKITILHFTTSINDFF